MKPGTCIAAFANYDGGLIGFSAPSPAGFTAPNTELKQEFMFQASEASLTCATAKGNLLALGGNEEVVKLFDLKTKKSCGDLSGEHTGPITCLVTTAKHVLSGSVDGMIVIWRTEDMEVIHKLVVKNVSKVVSLSMH
jgi:protein MAK11